MHVVVNDFLSKLFCAAPVRHVTLSTILVSVAVTSNSFFTDNTAIDAILCFVVKPPRIVVKRVFAWFLSSLHVRVFRVCFHQVLWLIIFLPMKSMAAKGLIHLIHTCCFLPHMEWCVALTRFWPVDRISWRKAAYRIAYWPPETRSFYQSYQSHVKDISFVSCPLLCRLRLHLFVVELISLSPVHTVSTKE